MSQLPEVDVPLDEKVAFLSRPESYPEQPASVEAIETHMSWVFLTREHAYKLKKPVKYDYLDFSTIEQRHRDCQEELRLNARLAKGVYLDVVPLTMAGNEGLQLNGPDAIADWLVRMRRLPRERMLDTMIAEETVHGHDVEPLGGLLADFYAAQESVAITVNDYLAHFAQELKQNLKILSQPSFAMPMPKVEALHNSLLRFMEEQRSLLERRVEEGRIVEGHGDLRPEHICLKEPPLIIDALEFNRRFRLIDPVDELSFLAMECERLGAHWIGPTLLATYCAHRQDAPSDRLIDFYKCFRAVLRARLVLRHLDDPEPREAARWPQLAATYLNLAEQHARSFLPAKVVI